MWKPEDGWVGQIVPAAHGHRLPRPEVTVGGGVQFALFTSGGGRSWAADHKNAAAIGRSGTNLSALSYSSLL